MISKLNELKKEIQRLRPEIMIGISTSFKDGKKTKHYRKPNLEDVLAVCDGKIKDLENTGGYLQTWRLKDGNHNLFNFWLLGKPLDDQTEETINFIHSLIFK